MTMSSAHRYGPGEARPYARPADWPPDSATYRIGVKGCLDTSWSEWFDGLAITADCERGETTLAGRVADQTALHGLLNKVRNLGLTLLWLKRVDSGGETIVTPGNTGEEESH